MRKLSRAPLAVVGLVAAAPLLAQEGSSSSEALLGAYGGVAQKTAIHGVCSDPFFFGGRVGYQPNRFVVLEGAGTIHGDMGEACATALFTPHVPIPSTGAWTFHRREHQHVGMPFATTEGRLILQTPEGKRPSGFRVIGGAGWMWGKSVGFTLAGLGIHFGSARLRGTIDLERWWFEAPYTDVTSMYEDGELVSETKVRGATNERTTSLRIGFRWRP